MNYVHSDADVNAAARAFCMHRGTPSRVLPFMKLNEHAMAPEYGSAKAAGMDLRANLRCEVDEDGAQLEVVTIMPGARKLVKTGIAVACPPGHYARIAPRSGLAFKKGIDVLAGVVDEDYRGDVGVILVNLGDEPFTFSHGERIAQLVIEQYTPCLPAECHDLDDSSRGSGGFGSTGTA